VVNPGIVSMMLKKGRYPNLEYVKKVGRKKWLESPERRHFTAASIAADFPRKWYPREEQLINRIGEVRRDCQWRFTGWSGLDRPAMPTRDEEPYPDVPIGVLETTEM
jgi:hypothetical protein